MTLPTTATAPTTITVTLRQRDASFYVSRARHPAVPEVKDAMAAALATLAYNEQFVSFDLDRETAHWFCHKATRPLPLPYEGKSLNQIILTQLRRRTDQVPQEATEVATSETNDVSLMGDVIGLGDVISQSSTSDDDVFEDTHSDDDGEDDSAEYVHVETPSSEQIVSVDSEMYRPADQTVELNRILGRDDEASTPTQQLPSWPRIRHADDVDSSTED